MKALLCLVPFTVFALAHCGTGDTRPPSEGGGETTTTAGNGSAKACRATCRTAIDCAQTGQPLQDANHFACNEGKCEWLGCKSTSECTAALQRNAVTCEAPTGQSVPICVATCEKSADCAVSGSVLGDENHFTCDAGKCRWTGCKSTSECSAALGNNKTVCEKPEGAETPICTPTCEKAADCAVPGTKLNDASHYVCKAGRCEWLGCKTTAECAADLRVSNVVCD